MSIRVTNIKLNAGVDQSKILQSISKKLNVKPREIIGFSVIRQSIDARKDTVNLIYSLDVEVVGSEERILKRFKNDPTISKAEVVTIPKLTRGSKKLLNRPIVVGAGPSGIFAALSLATYGYKPLLLERGKEVTERARDIESFWQTGKLNLSSNIQFGEGGAGTFSDGKLTTRIKDYRVRQVLESFVKAGAPEDILYINKPHLGTDKLRRIVYNLRQEIVRLGGEVAFNSQVTELIIEAGKVKGVVINGQEEIYSNVVILAIGHSARDTYNSLYESGVNLEAKSFAIGARIEHPQKTIDTAQYGKYAGHPKLGAAEYQLVYNNKEHNRSAYSFCMCPGGYVVGAASEEAGVVTNGMSEYNRDSGIANSALVASVSPEDFPSKSPLAGVEFQRTWEKKAYSLGQGGYKAPVQKVSDFLTGKASTDDLNLDLATYKPGVKPSDLHEALPGYVTEMMEQAIAAFGKRLKGFDSPNATLTGVETRTSAPVRILREDTGQAQDIEGLYPAGEGAGYAGGIISAAVDGIKASEKIIEGYGKGD